MKDLAAALRGEETGIAASEVAVGEGVNAENIKKCLEFLKETNWDGDISIECSGTDDKIASSVKFLRAIVLRKKRREAFLLRNRSPGGQHIDIAEVPETWY